jgi:predicted RNA-binding protein YlxR (DUF448 family)
MTRLDSFASSYVMAGSPSTIAKFNLAAGAYLHPRPECLERALKRRSLGRALRSEIDGQQAAVTIRQFLSALT